MTGRQTWHYREPGQRMNGMASTEGVLVLTSMGWPTLEDGDRRVVAVDIATGRVLWEEAESWSIEGDSLRGPDRIGDASAAVGTVVMTETRRPKPIGLV